MAHRPFDNVPPEILSHILTFAWSSYVGDDSTGRFLFPSIPIQVNRKFNSAALSTPTLWSYLRVSGIKGLGHIQHRIENRSGALPLDLYLIFTGVTHEEAQEMVERSIGHSPSRFQSITLSYLNDAVIDSPVAQFWDHLQPLSSLLPPLNPARFSISNRSIDVTPLNFFIPLGPALRRLDLSYCNLTWPTVSLPSNLEDLSIQEGRHVSGATLLEILGAELRCSLQSLSIGCVGVTGAADMPANSYILDGLTRLHLGHLYFYELESLLNIIGAPNIRHLSLENIYANIGFPMAMTTWHALRFPNLQKLTIQGFNSGMLGLAALVENLPTSVDCLEITIERGKHEAVGDLFKPSTTAFCSQLHHIIARGLRPDDLTKLVEERCTSLHTLQVTFTNSACEIHHSLAKGQLSAYFRRLMNSVTVLKVLRDGVGDDIDEQTTLAFEEFEQQQRSLVENSGGISEDGSY